MAATRLDGRIAARTTMIGHSGLTTIALLLTVELHAQALRPPTSSSVDSITFVERIYPLRQTATSGSGASRLRIPVRKMRVAGRATLPQTDLAALLVVADSVHFWDLPNDLSSRKEWCASPANGRTVREVTFYWPGGAKRVERPGDCEAQSAEAMAALAAYRTFEDQVFRLTRPWNR